MIDRELFNKLIENGLICDKKNNKNFYITNQKKGKSKRKKIYICEKVLDQFNYLLRKKKVQDKNVNNNNDNSESRKKPLERG